MKIINFYQIIFQNNKRCAHQVTLRLLIKYYLWNLKFKLRNSDPFTKLLICIVWSLCLHILQVIRTMFLEHISPFNETYVANCSFQFSNCFKSQDAIWIIKDVHCIHLSASAKQAVSINAYNNGFKSKCIISQINQQKHKMCVSPCDH